MRAISLLRTSLISIRSQVFLNPLLISIFSKIEKTHSPITPYFNSQSFSHLGENNPIVQKHKHTHIDPQIWRWKDVERTIKYHRVFNTNAQQ